MAKAMLNLSVQPYRMMKKGDAAAYCGISVGRFSVLCKVSPIEYSDGTRLWDVRDLDAWLDGLKGGSSDDDESILERLG